MHVEGQFVFNTAPPTVAAALDGAGPAFLPEDEVLDQIKTEAPLRLLKDWCPPFPGYHLYDSSLRQPSAAFMLMVEALRYRA